MTLWARLVSSILLVFAVSLALGGMLAGRHAQRTVRTELGVALSVASRSVQQSIAGSAATTDAPAVLAQLVAAFDDDRHVRARRRDPDGREIAASRLSVPADPAPSWFRSLLAAPLPPLTVAVPLRLGGGTVELASDPVNETSEVWGEFRDAMLVLSLFCLAVVLLIHLLVRRALRPLDALLAAFRRVGAGDYEACVVRRGPAEFRRLADGLNAMSRQLGALDAQNRRLHEQILTLQEEERAELARDLHDDVGPFLFAVAIHAAELRRLAAGTEQPEVLRQVQALLDALGHAQKHVRAILGRLRPVRPVAFGLAPALEGLVAFWRQRCPAAHFAVDVTVAEDGLSEAHQETIYRVVQESLSNAIRHGAPRHIAIVVAQSPDGGTLVQVTDDGAGTAVPGQAPGFGIAGMRERVAALGGVLSIETGHDGGGWTVLARLPLRERVAAAEILVAP